MLVLYNPKTSNRSLVNTPHSTHKSIAIQPNRTPHQIQNTLPNKRTMMSKTTDDIFSNIRAHHLQIFQQVENFQRNIFKQVDEMFSMGSMGGFGGCRSPMHHMSSKLSSFQHSSYLFIKADHKAREIKDHKGWFQRLMFTKQRRMHQETHIMKSIFRIIML